MRKLFPNLDRDDSLDTVLEVPIPDEMLINAPGADKRRGARGADMRAWLKNQAFDRATVDGTASATHPLPRPARPRFQPLHPRLLHPSIDGQVHHPAVHRGDGRAGGSAGGAEHVHRWEGADVRVRVPPRRPDGHHRRCAGPRRGRRLRALAEDPRGLVLRAHHGRPQDERRQRQQGRVAPVRRRAVLRLARPATPPPALSPGPGSTLHREPLLRRGVHRREDPQQRGVLHPEAGGRRGDAAGAERPGVRHHPPRTRCGGYFSQRTGLLIQLEDSHLLRMKSGKGHRRSENIFWETSMESVISDYRCIDGINIAHGGHTNVTLFRYGEGSVNHKRKLEETWTVEEADFNVHGLTTDYFLPPADLKDVDDQNK